MYRFPVFEGVTYLKREDVTATTFHGKGADGKPLRVHAVPYRPFSYRGYKFFANHTIEDGVMTPNFTVTEESTGATVLTASEAKQCQTYDTAIIHALEKIKGDFPKFEAAVRNYLLKFYGSSSLDIPLLTIMKLI